ncbi:MAG: hypothetical protein GY708_11100 [Actinomycetia bacterium]|nr:hypothetical protein [Actinomycetes bacterium]
MAGEVERDPIPESFESLQQAADFWDEHDVADYEDLTREAHFEVDLKRRVFLTALEPQLAKRVAAYARRQGISSETLINTWLSEKLASATAHG